MKLDLCFYFFPPRWLLSWFFLIFPYFLFSFWSVFLYLSIIAEFYYRGHSYCMLYFLFRKVLLFSSDLIHKLDFVILWIFPVVPLFVPWLVSILPPSLKFLLPFSFFFFLQRVLFCSLSSFILLSNSCVFATKSIQRSSNSFSNSSIEMFMFILSLVNFPYLEEGIKLVIMLESNQQLNNQLILPSYKFRKVLLVNDD